MFEIQNSLGHTDSGIILLFIMEKKENTQPGQRRLFYK